MKKALIILAVLVAVALIWEQIPAAREVTVDDYATDQHGSYLARWGVYYYEVIGTDTTLVDMDTTDSYGAYEITAPTGSYLIYAFPLWDDSTDTSLSRKSFMNKQTIVAVDNDTAFFRYAKADSDFVGDITGNITGTADSAGVAHKAHTANDFTVRGKIKEWPTESYGAIPFVIRLDDGKDIHADWGRIAAQEGVPLTYYIITEELGSAGTMTCAEVCSAYGLGHEIGSHTCSGRNLVTLYAAGEYDSCITELSLSQTYLESLLHADADSFAEVRTFVFTGNAANEPLRRWAAKYYDLVSGTSGGIDYTATMEGADLYNLRLWDAGSFIDSASVRAASGKTDSAWVADTLSALVAIWKDSSAVSGNYKNYGQRNIGGFYLHGESYVVGGDTLYSGLDTTLFRDMMQAVKTHADAGDLWLVTMAELADWYRDNLNSIDNRWFTQNQYFSSIYHDADPFSDQVYQTNFRNYYGTQFLYENKYSATGNDSGTACMRVVNAVDGGYGIKYEDYGDGVALYALTGTSPANEGSQDGRAAMVEVRGRPGASALYAYCKDDSTYGVRVHVLPSIDDVPNTHAFYSNRGKHTLGTALTDSTRMQTATVAGNLAVGGDADITGDISCDDLTAADSVKGVNVVASTKLWAGAGDFGAAGVDITGHLNVDGLTDFDDEVDIGGGGLTMSAGGDIGAATTGSQITSFDYATILHIYAADSVKTNSQSGVMVSHTFETSGDQGSGFHGDLTGTADHATTASTCTIWTGSGTVNDTLAALRADVVNLDATVSTHGDSLTALTTDIAALQATKVDTNEAYVHRDAIDWTPESQLNASILKGNASAPWYSPTDTVVVDRFWVNYYGSAAGGEWEIILLNTSGDTISWTDTLTASGWQGYDDQSPSNTIITPADGFYLDVNEISGTTNLTRPSFRVEFYYINP